MTKPIVHRHLHPNPSCVSGFIDCKQEGTVDITMFGDKEPRYIEVCDHTEPWKPKCCEVNK